MTTSSDILQALDESNSRIDDRKLKIRERSDFPVCLNDVSKYTVDQLAGAIAEAIASTGDGNPIRCIELYGDGERERCVLDIYDASRVEIFVGVSPGLPLNEDVCRSMLNPLAESIGGELVGVRRGYDPEDEIPLWDVVVHLNDLGITPERLEVFANEVRRMIELPPQSKNFHDLGWLVNMLRSSRLGVIVGCAESNWLDFKMLTDVESNSGKIKIAREVAAFANGDRSAVLVIGYKTDKVDGVDIAVKLTPVTSRWHEPDRYRKIIDERIVPHVRGLEVNRVDAGGGTCVVWILIPAQPDQLKPFLVRGAIVDSKTRGEFFSIDVRRGDATMSVDAREIHAWISAGRQQIMNQAGDRRTPSSS